MITLEIMRSHVKEARAILFMCFTGSRLAHAWKTVKPTMIAYTAFWKVAFSTLGTATPKGTPEMSPSAPGGVPSLELSRMRRMEISCCAIWNSYDVMPATKVRYMTQAEKQHRRPCVRVCECAGGRG
jgi:hypothetical protein